MFVDHDDRLAVLNDEATVVFIWQPEAKQWVAGSTDFARKAWADGTDLTEDEAKKRFPEADWDNLPEV